MPVQYKDFKVSEIFRLVNPKGKLTTKQLISGSDIAYVAAKKTNNGVAMMCSRENIPDEQVMPGNCIVFVQQGDGSAGYTTYQPNDFYAISCVCCGYIDGILNEKIGLYLVSVLDKNKALYSHSNSWSGEKLLNTKMPLPVTPSGTPDWDYMQEYISELEQERVSELEKYLAATGLDDYELTDDDREVLEISGFRRDENGKPVGSAGGRKEMREFRMGDLFTSENGDVDLQQKDVNGKGIALVSSGEANAGIIGLTDVLAKIIPENTITVDMFGSVHYRDFSYKMVTHARVFALIPKFDMCREIGEFLTSAVKKCTTHFSYNNMCSWNKTCGMVLRLPICTDAANNPVIDPAKTWHPDGYVPDWDFMSRYIRAIEKMVVKDVVDYKNEFIARTKAVVL